MCSAWVPRPHEELGKGEGGNSCREPFTSCVFADKPLALPFPLLLHLENKNISLTFLFTLIFWNHQSFLSSIFNHRDRAKV